MIRVLCVDDNPHDRALIRDALEREADSFAMIEASDRKAFEKALVKGGFDVVLTDFNILGFEGLEVVQKVKERFPDIPVIVVTGTGSEEVAVAALKQGADDYVIKSPRHIARLPFTIHQVLEFHKARQKLRQKDKNLQDILRNMSIGILVVNRAGTILYANPAGLEMFGNPAKGLEGKPFGYPITPGVSVDIDLPLRPGGPGVAEMGATQGIWEDKECYIVMLRDITERKKAEEALTKAKEHLEHVLSVIPVIVYTLDPESLAPTWVSPNIAAMLGYSPEEVLESGSGWWRDHLHPEDKDKAQALKEEIFAKGHHFHEYRFRKKDGEYLWLRDEFRVVNDAQGKPVEIVGAWNDVTRERQMEEEQRKLEEQLHQAQRLESVGRMAGGVAHDFNNMLNVILGYADLIHQKLHPGDPLRENVEQILRAAQRSADLTRQLLAFSRKQTLQPEVLDLNNVVRNIEKMLHRLIGEDIALELALSGDLSPVKIDRGQMEQVIMNLAVNARDAMPTGGKLLIETSEVELDEAYARTHTDVKPGKYVMLAVTDTGVGMDEETLTKIFEPFFSTKEKGKGTGLGLSTVYGIVKQSGGSIFAYSEPGQGTTFKIYLPVTDEQVGARAEETARKEPTGGGEHILVVEDEEDLRGLLETVLSRLGYKVSLAANGGEALLLVEEKGLEPDLIITDVIMPGMSGSVLVERLKRTQPDLKVLYMSGYTDNAIVHHGVLDPGTPFIQKPFTIAQIAEKVRAVLRGGRT